MGLILQRSQSIFNNNPVVAEIKLLIILLIYKATFDIYYACAVYPVYSYEGYTYDFLLYKFVISYVILIVLYKLFPHDEIKPSSVSLSLILLIYIIPILSCYSLGSYPTEYLLFVLMGFLTISCTIKILPKPKIKEFSLNAKSLYIACVVVLISALLATVARYGVPSFAALSFSDVYTIRESNLDKSSMLLEYLSSWSIYSVAPFLMLIYLEKKQYINLFLVLAFFSILYLILAAKGIFFLPLLIFFLFYSLRRRRFFLYFTLSIVSLLLIDMYLFYKTGNFYILFFIQRIFFDPILGSTRYYDFFSNNEFVYLSDSIFKWFIDYPYSEPIPSLIGYLQYASYSWNNVNFYMDDAYMHFGVAGIFIFSGLLALLMIVTDSLYFKRPSLVVLIFSVLIIYRITSGPMLTALSSRGGAFSILLILFYVCRKEITNADVCSKD